jgi:hypothetical protein
VRATARALQVWTCLGRGDLLNWSQDEKIVELVEFESPEPRAGRTEECAAGTLRCARLRALPVGTSAGHILALPRASAVKRREGFPPPRMARGRF